MELFNDGGKIFVFSRPVSFRYGLKGLTSLALLSLQIDVMEDRSWLVFLNKSRNGVRIIHYTDRHGMLIDIRLRYGSRFPALVDDLNGGRSIALSREELEAMLTGHYGMIKFSSFKDVPAPKSPARGSQAA